MSRTSETVLPSFAMRALHLMTHATGQTRIAARWRALAAALPLLACSAAWSEANPYTIGFDQGRGQNAPDIVKNIEQTDQYGATVRVGVVTDLTMEGGLNHQSQRFSEVGNRLAQNSVNLGLRYLPTPTLEFDCSVARESRSAEQSILSYSYHANTVACAAQFSVQP